MSVQLILLLLLFVIKLTLCVRTSDITELGVRHYDNLAGVGCGIWGTELHIIGGCKEPSNINFPGASLNSTIWDININLNTETNGNLITTPQWRSTLLPNSVINVLTSMNGFSERSGIWFCDNSDCSYQLGSEKYIYIIGATVFSNARTFSTDEMAIYDMSTKSYIQPSKYKESILGGAKNGACVTGNLTHIFVIGGSANSDGSGVSTSVLMYKPPSDFINGNDDEWILMGNMNTGFYSRGCTFDKNNYFLYMFGGRNPSPNPLGYGGAEYLDLNEYNINGFDSAYYDLQLILDTDFFRSNSITNRDWFGPNCYPHPYAHDVIYCVGGENILRGSQSAGNPYNQIWGFERVYEFERYPKYTSGLNSLTTIQCKKKNGQFFTYPDCAGYIGFKVKASVEFGYETNDINAIMPRGSRQMCGTRWVSGTNSKYRFLIGGYTDINGDSKNLAFNPILIRERDSSIWRTLNPTSTPTETPTQNPVIAPSFSPIMAGDPTRSPITTAKPSQSPLPNGVTREPTNNPTNNETKKSGLTNLQIGIIGGVIGAICLILCIVVIIVLVVKKKSSNHGFDTEMS